MFFGKRGSGKTTIRMEMQRAYYEYNTRERDLAHSRGHFLVDLCRPGHMTACLRNFQETIHCNDDNWDAHFGVQPSPSRTCSVPPSALRARRCCAILVYRQPLRFMYAIHVRTSCMVTWG